MRIALVSGLWPTSDENGLLAIGTRLESEGHSYQIYHYDASSIASADIYIGHSFGGDRLVREAARTPMKYLVLIEPVYNNWLLNWFGPGGAFVIPTQTVERADCFIRKGLRLPPSSPIRNEYLNFKNHFIEGLDHSRAPTNSQIIDSILNAISKIS